MSKTLNTNNAYNFDQLQQQFKTVLAQVMHDIQSPLLCLLAMSLQNENAQSKNSGLDPQKIVARINRIISNIPKVIQSYMDAEKMSGYQEIIVFRAIENILAEKQVEYVHSTIMFEYNCTTQALNTTLEVNPDDFSRMLSNLLNNAVEAYGGKSGIIRVNLDADEQFIYLIIADNGIGMPDEVKNKILNNIAVTANKTKGQGMGFQQIQETLINANAKLAIDSEYGNGTKITLTFPNATASV